MYTYYHVTLHFRRQLRHITPIIIILCFRLNNFVIIDIDIHLTQRYCSMVHNIIYRYFYGKSLTFQLSSWCRESIINCNRPVKLPHVSLTGLISNDVSIDRTDLFFSYAKTFNNCSSAVRVFDLI